MCAISAADLAYLERSVTDCEFQRHAAESGFCDDRFFSELRLTNARLKIRVAVFDLPGAQDRGIELGVDTVRQMNIHIAAGERDVCKASSPARSRNDKLDT